MYVIADNSAVIKAKPCGRRVIGLQLIYSNAADGVQVLAKVPLKLYSTGDEATSGLASSCTRTKWATTGGQRKTLWTLREYTYVLYLTTLMEPKAPRSREGWQALVKLLV